MARTKTRENVEREENGGFPKGVDPNTRTFKCHDCDQTFPIGEGPVLDYAIYTVNDQTELTCRECDKLRCLKNLESSDTFVLYFTQDKEDRHRCKVTNWTSMVNFPGRCSKGSHNWRDVERYDVWFRDHEGKPWHGVNMCGRHGINQLLRCKRVKESPNFPIPARKPA